MAGDRGITPDELKAMGYIKAYGGKLNNKNKRGLTF
jgi:hypothetical protein